MEYFRLSYRCLSWSLIPSQGIAKGQMYRRENWQPLPWLFHSSLEIAKKPIVEAEWQEWRIFYYMNLVPHVVNLAPNAMWSLCVHIPSVHLVPCPPAVPGVRLPPFSAMRIAVAVPVAARVPRGAGPHLPAAQWDAQPVPGRQGHLRVQGIQRKVLHHTKGEERKFLKQKSLHFLSRRCRGREVMKIKGIAFTNSNIWKGKSLHSFLGFTSVAFSILVGK